MTKLQGEVLLDFDTVSAKVALRRTKIYQLIKAGDFPAPIKLTPSCSRWRLSEVDSWIDSKISSRAA
jgi:prophage regulatory protein